MLTLYSVNENAETQSAAYRLQREETGLVLIRADGTKQTLRIAENEPETDGRSYVNASGTCYHFKKGGVYEIREPVKGAKLTILAFEKAFGKAGAYLVCIGIVLFAFSTIIGWEYQGEKAFEYLSGTHRYHMAYRIVYACFVYAGATMTLDLVWNLSDIANALMALPNLICLLALSGTVSAEALKFEKEKKKAHRSAE